MPEFIDPVFAKTSPNRSFSMTENERFELVFAENGSINKFVKQSMGARHRLGIGLSYLEIDLWAP